MCRFSFAQNWTALGDTKIEYASIIDQDRDDTTVFFKKDSKAIGVPVTMSTDFQQLFLQDQQSFDIINDSCMHLRTLMLGDSVELMFKSYQIKHLVYFVDRKIIMKKDEETWGMMILYGQGQPCWPVIFIKRMKNKLSIKFISFNRGFCEI